MAYKLPHVVDERSDVVTGTGAALFGVTELGRAA